MTCAKLRRASWRCPQRSIIVNNFIALFIRFVDVDKGWVSIVRAVPPEHCRLKLLQDLEVQKARH